MIVIQNVLCTKSKSMHSPLFWQKNFYLYRRKWRLAHWLPKRSRSRMSHLCISSGASSFCAKATWLYTALSGSILSSGRTSRSTGTESNELDRSLDHCSSRSLAGGQYRAPAATQMVEADHSSFSMQSE